LASWKTGDYGSVAGLALDLDALALGFFRPGQGQFQHAVAVVRLGLARLHSGTERWERA